MGQANKAKANKSATQKYIYTYSIVCTKCMYIDASDYINTKFNWKSFKCKIGKKKLKQKEKSKVIIKKKDLNWRRNGNALSVNI